MLDTSEKELAIQQASLFDVNELITYGQDTSDHGELIVTQRNELIFASNEVTLKAGKVIDALLTRVNPFNKDTVKVEISTVELARILGQTRQAVQRTIKEIVKELQSQVIIIPTRFKLHDQLLSKEKLRAEENNKKPSRVSMPNDDGFEMVNWFHKSVYDSNKGVVIVQFHDEVVPLLVGFNSNFTQYSIKNTRHMTSKYGRGLYRIARSILSIKSIINGQYEASKVIELEEFRRVMGATQEGYDVFSELSKRVIKKALTDLENSDLKVVIQIPERPTKTSRAKITKLKIIVSTRELLMESNWEFWWKLWMIRTRERLEQKYSPARIQRNTKMVINQLLVAQVDPNANKIRSVSSYLGDFVSKDYAGIEDISSDSNSYTSEQRKWVNNRLKKIWPKLTDEEKDDFCVNLFDSDTSKKYFVHDLLDDGNYQSKKTNRQEIDEALSPKNILDTSWYDT